MQVMLMNANDVPAVLTEVSRELDACEQDLCLRDIRREVESDDQTFLIACLLRKIAGISHSHWARTYLTECADQLDHLGKDLRSLRIADEIEHDKAMRDPRYRWEGE